VRLVRIKHRAPKARNPLLAGMFRLHSASPVISTDHGGGKRLASDFGRMDFMDKFTALLSGRRLGYIEYAGLNLFATESD